MTDNPFEKLAEENNMEICDCGRPYNPEFSDGAYCRSCMMEKQAKEDDRNEE